MGRILRKKIEQLSPQDRADLEELLAEGIDWKPAWQQLKLDVEKAGGKPITNLELVRGFFRFLYDDASDELLDS